jgi:hypothetical protein
MASETIKTSTGEWYKNEQDQWRFRATGKKSAGTIGKRKSTRINLDANAFKDEISDPDLLKESGGHIDPDTGDFVEDEL